MNEEDGELCRNRKLGDVGVVVKDVIVFDELHEAVKDYWRNVQFFLKSVWMIASEVA